MSQPPFDPRRFKDLERAGFNRIAARYAAGSHLRSELAAALLEAAQLAPGQRVLDIASGPGLLARAAARRVGGDGLVLASDIAEAMLAHSAAQAAEPGAAPLLHAAADAEQLCLPAAAFDRVLMGLGLFMLPHPPQALAEIRRVLRPAGALALSVWGPRDSVPLISCAQDCIARLLPAPKVARPSVFRFGDADTLASLLAEAGFRRLDSQLFHFHCDFPSPAAYWQAFLDLAGGAAEALRRLPEPRQQQLQQEVAHELQPWQHGNGYRLPACARIATAWRD